MAVLELRYQSPDPSAPRQPPRRPYGHYTVDSIPFHSPPLPSAETILETHRTIPPFPMQGKTPPWNTGLPAMLPRKPCPHFHPLAHDALYSLRCICMTPTHLNRRLFTADYLSLSLSLSLFLPISLRPLLFLFHPPSHSPPLLRFIFSPAVSSFELHGFLAFR